MQVTGRDIESLVQTELRKAKKKFPEWPIDPIHAAGIVAEESGELMQAALQYTYEDGLAADMFTEAIQTAAMAIRFIENILTYRRIQQQ